MFAAVLNAFILKRNILGDLSKILLISNFCNCSCYPLSNFLSYSLWPLQLFIQLSCSQLLSSSFCYFISKCLSVYLTFFPFNILFSFTAMSLDTFSLSSFLSVLHIQLKFNHLSLFLFLPPSLSLFIPYSP